MTVTRETVAYFRRTARPLPSIVELNETPRRHAMYALHDPVHGLKAGAHHARHEADPDDEGAPDPQLVERIAAWVRERHPGRRPGAGRARRRASTPRPSTSVRPRTPRPGRHRLAVLGPRLQVRAGGRQAARRSLALGLGFRHALLPAPRRRPAQAPHPVPRERDAPHRGGDGARGLHRQRVDPLPPAVAVPRDEARRLRADRAQGVGARPARAPALQDGRREARAATRSPAAAS